MPDYTKATGSASTMTIRDNGSTIEFWLTMPGTARSSDIPWASTIDGRTEWRVFDTPSHAGVDPPTRTYQFLTRAVTYSQTVGFQLGDTNITEVGGPTDFYQYLKREAGGSGAHLQSGNTIRKAIPYVNVNGVWRVAEPWSRIAGEWKQTI